VTKFSRCFEWMEVYVNSAIPLMKEGITITRITAWAKSNNRVGKGVQACIITNDESSFRVYIKTHRHPRGEEPTPYTKLELLELLAHELAHIVSFDHTPEHKKLEAKLLTIFMNQLESEGYVSSEEEERIKNR
jgi:hypothetical protein